MTPSRFILRLVLIMALLGVVYVGWKVFVKRSPTYYSDQAVMALRAGDRKSAVSFYRRSVTDLKKRNAQDPEIRQLIGDAHERLGELYLQEAKELGHPDTYSTNPFALEQMGLAAQFRVDDLELQKKFLTICLEIPFLDSAAQAAGRVVKQEPNNADAVFALAWDAVDKLHSDAEVYLKQLEKLDSSRKFQALHLRLYLESQTQHRDAEIQGYLKQAAALAAQLDEKQVVGQSRFERDSMIKLLIFSINQATDPKIASAHAENVINTCEKMAKLEVPAEAPAGAESGGLFSAGDEKAAPKKPQINPEEVGNVGVGYYANLVSQAVLILNTKFPVDPKNVSDKANRERLSERANALRLQAISAGQATPLVYHQAAMVLFTDGKQDDALKLLAEALDPARKFSDSRRKELLELNLLAARQLLIAHRFDLVEKHLKPLDDDKEYEGWGQLLHGAVATANGAHEKARGHYERAQRKLGNITLIHMALANTYMQLKEWEKALTHLQQLRDNVNSNDPLTQTFNALNKTTENQVHWGEFQAYLELNRLSDAQGKLRELEKTEFGARSWAHMANHFLKQKDLATAMAVLNEGRQKFPTDLTIANLYIRMLSNEGKTAEAGAAMEQMAKAAPDDLTAQLLLVRFYITQGKHREAIAMADALTRKFGEQVAISVIKAQALLAADRPQEAVEVADGLEKMKDGLNAARLIKLAVSLKQKNLPGAADELSDLQSRLPDNGQLGVIRGQIEMGRGNFAAAADNFGIALDMTELREKAGQGALNSLVMLAQQQGPIKAEEKLGELISKYPDNKHLLICRAELKFRQGQFEDGLKALDRLEQVLPNDPLPHFLKAGGWWKRKRIDKAKDEIKLSLAKDAKHVDSYSLLADIQLGEKKYKQAIAAAEEGLKLDSKAMKLYLVQAEAMSKLGFVNEAVAAVQKVLDQQPKNLPARRQMAQIYIDANRVNDALKVYRDGRAISAEGHDDLHTLSDVEFALLADEITLLSKNKRFDEASKLVTSVVGGSPSPAQCLQLALAFSQADQYAEARKWGEKALAQLPGNLQPQAHLVLGRNALKWSRAEPANKELAASARDHFARVVEVNPRNFEAANNLAFLLATEFNQGEQAVKIAETLQGNLPVDQLPTDFVDTLAICYTRANRGADAEKVLSDVLRIRPDDAALNFQLGMVYVTLKKTASARGCFEKALRLPDLSEEKTAIAKEKLEWLNSLSSAPAPAAAAPNN